MSDEPKITIDKLRTDEVAAHRNAALRALDRLRRRTLDDARRRGELAEAEAAIGYDLACIQLGMQAERHALESGIDPKLVFDYKARWAAKLAGETVEAVPIVALSAAMQARAANADLCTESGDGGGNTG